MGNSPLKLIVLRRWHDANTFTDLLECGHEVRCFPDFTWESGRLVNLAPTAKRRRCQKCAEIARVRGNAVSRGEALRDMEVRPVIPKVWNWRPEERSAHRPDSIQRIGGKTQAVNDGDASNQDAARARLYSDCIAETSLPSPKKPCASERDPARGKKAA